jgi:hypothetical protein
MVVEKGEYLVGNYDVHVLRVQEEQFYGKRNFIACVMFNEVFDVLEIGCPELGVYLVGKFTSEHSVEGMCEGASIVLRGRSQGLLLAAGVDR